MGTKVKGFFKGFKNISNIFEDEEDQEIQIGMPTDVKHIAHIGADGPATESPSWMRGYDGGHGQSESMDSSDFRKGKNHRSTRSEEFNRDLSDVPKTSRHRHHRSMDNSMDPDSQSSARPKHRRHHRIRRPHKGDLPDLPKRSRQKKPKEDDESS